jgi:carbonic anhydrase/acetyltransferase-like protein (isoleucine patch superfamily)
VYGQAEIWGRATIYDHAKVCGYAKVYGHAEIFGNAKIYNHAKVCDKAKVYGRAEIFGNAKIYNHAKVCDKAKVSDHAIIRGKARITGRAKVCGDKKVDGNMVVSGTGVMAEDPSQSLITPPKIATKVVVRRDGKMVHAAVKTNYASVMMTECGLKLHKTDENYSEHDHDERFIGSVVNCKRCRKSLGLDNKPVTDKMGERFMDKIQNFNKHQAEMSRLCEENEHSEKPVESQDAYYEVMLKDGETITLERHHTGVESAQEAAVECGLLFGTAMDEIKCIRRVRVEKVIFPTVKITFED